MSRISTLLDEAHTAVSALLPNHTRLSNPYQIEQNPDNWLDKGYAIAIGPGTNTNRKLSCQLSIERTLVITVTRKYFANDTDAARKYTTEKLLEEDQFLIVKSFEKRSPFQTISVRSAFVGDNGIQIVVPDRPFYMLQSNFVVEYFENLNT